MDPLQALLKNLKANDPAPPEKKQEEPEQLAPSVFQPAGKVTLTLSSGIHVPAEVEPVIRPMLQKLTFKNPAHAQAMKYGRTLPDEFLYGYRRATDGGFILPRGDLRGVLNFFHQKRIQVDLVDRTIVSPMPDDGGSFSAPTPCLPADLESAFSLSSGKRSGLITGGDGVRDRAIIALHVVFHGQRTLIVCHRAWQLYAWRNALTQATGLKDEDIGILGDGRHQVDRPVTVAISRSLKKSLDVFKKSIGFLVVDGCGYVGMPVFFDIVWQLPARYLIGISGSEPRSDGLEKLMRAFMGEPVVSLPRVFASGRDRSLSVSRTDFVSSAASYEAAVSDLCADDARTNAVVMDILALSAEKSARVVVVASRLEYMETIRDGLSDQYRTADILSGKVSQSKASEILSNFASGKLQVVLTTGGSLELLPQACASAVVVAVPFQKRDLAAAIVRMMKPGSVLKDYRDDHPMLIASLKKRERFYNRLHVV